MNLKTWSVLIVITTITIFTVGIDNQAVAQSSSNAATGNNSAISSNYADLVLVDYDGNNRVVLMFYETESTYGWEAIDLLEDSYGYKLA